MKGTTLQTTTRDGLTVSFINEEEFEEFWHEIFQVRQDSTVTHGDTSLEGAIV